MKVHSLLRSFVVATVLILVSAAGPTVSAQGRMMSAEDRAEQLAKRLELNVEQKGQLLKVYQALQKEMQEKIPDLMGDREAMRKAMQEINAKGDKEIEKMLTKEQLVKYGEFKKERQQMRGRQRRNN
jgi:TolA-binding protein